MNSCCVAFKPNSPLLNTRNCYGNGNGDIKNAFLGERTRGSVWFNQLSNTLRGDDKKGNKIKSGVFAVLTSNTPREAVVCFNFFPLFCPYVILCCAFVFLYDS